MMNYGVAVALSAFLVLVALYPLSRLAERVVTKRALPWVVLASSVVVSVLFGFWLYTGFLHRLVALVAQRDFPYVLCFSLIGIAYALTYHFLRRA